MGQLATMVSKVILIIPLILIWLVGATIYLLVSIAIGFLMRLLFSVDWGAAILIGCATAYVSSTMLVNLTSETASLENSNDQADLSTNGENEYKDNSPVYVIEQLQSSIKSSRKRKSSKK